MNRIVASLLALGLSLTTVGLGWAAEPNIEQAKAIAEIEKLGGKVTIDEGSPDKPVVGVDLRRSQVTDAGLEHLKGLTKLQWLGLHKTRVTDAGLEHLKGLTEFQGLYLPRTKVTDAGLEHVKSLTKLQSLDLMDTQVTDAGLARLQGLTELQTLDLSGTKVTDAGLEHLKGLAGLQRVGLWQSKVTAAGVRDLQKALPNCEIGYAERSFFYPIVTFIVVVIVLAALAIHHYRGTSSVITYLRPWFVLGAIGWIVFLTLLMPFFVTNRSPAGTFLGFKIISTEISMFLLALLICVPRGRSTVATILLAGLLVFMQVGAWTGLP